VRFLSTEEIGTMSAEEVNAELSHKWLMNFSAGGSDRFLGMI
jgi:hypothetical protein